MPAVERRPSVFPQKFSIQGCEASEGVSVPSKRHKPLANWAFGLPLFTRRDVASVAAGHDGTSRAGGRLSLGHNDTPPDLSGQNDSDLPPSASKTFRIWPGAALGEVPGIPNHSHSAGSQTRKKSKRGKVLSFSESSRRNLQAKLAKILVSAELFTMCLSLPGWVDHFTHANVKAAFLRFGKMLTAKIARDSGFSRVGVVWKQELQQRNQLHFHLIFSGVSDENLDSVWRWCVDHWLQCVMDIPGMPPELVASEIAKMRAVHLFAGTKNKGFRDSNFQKIRGNFHSYFAKYLGKDVEAHCAESPIPGRWWGCLNGESIPFAKVRELELPGRVAVHAQRVARKVRQARADNAKHGALCRRFGGMAADGFTPAVSRQQLQRFFHVWNDCGGLSALDSDLPGICGRLRRAVGSGAALCSALAMFCKASEEGFRLSEFVSGFQFPPAMKFSRVRLTGAHVPKMMVRILQYAGERALIDRDQTPF